MRCFYVCLLTFQQEFQYCTLILFSFWLSEKVTSLFKYGFSYKDFLRSGPGLTQHRATVLVCPSSGIVNMNKLIYISEKSTTS